MSTNWFLKKLISLRARIIARCEKVWTSQDAFATCMGWQIGAVGTKRVYRDPRFDLWTERPRAASLDDDLDRLFRRLGPPPDHLRAERAPVLRGGGGESE
ncbi:hypothetical protein Misp01_30220 [Microtetraspora sp. NBRC 13810]|nr:hypothetical protein Misp01_30220 [Microtetraspora sp. NBRC 13810]